jgi:hypothetical protein
MKGFIEFEFDLPEALLTNLVRVFDSMDSADLTQENVAQIADAQGVYQLLLDGQLVYIGKTDAEAGLRKRLERHARTIQHRLNLDATRVTFKAVRVFVFTAIDLETQLIRHYGRAPRSRGISAVLARTIQGVNAIPPMSSPMDSMTSFPSILIASLISSSPLPARLRRS